MKDGKREENLLPFFGKVEKMKKLALFMLTMLMVFTLAACGDNVSITKTEAAAEVYECSDFSMTIPKGWVVTSGGTNIYHSIRVYDPSEPINQMFVLLKADCLLHSKAGKEAWQPTRRYNVLVQDIAASRIYDEVMRIQAKYAQNGDDDDRGLLDHLESNDAVRDDADIAYHRDVDGDSPSDAGLPLVDGDLGDGQMAVDFDAESSTASKTDHPLVDEHGIEYAEGYFDDEPVSIFDDDAPDKA